MQTNLHPCINMFVMSHKKISSLNANVFTPLYLTIKVHTLDNVSVGKKIFVPGRRKQIEMTYTPTSVEPVLKNKFHQVVCRMKHFKQRRLHDYEAILGLSQNF